MLGRKHLKKEDRIKVLVWVNEGRCVKHFECSARLEKQKCVSVIRQ